MERKEHPVATISGGGKILKLLDPDGNPYTPPDPVDYQILDEDGKVLKEGTVKDTDQIPLDDVSATSFRVMIDSHLVLDTSGFDSPVEDEDQKTIDGPSFDPDDDTYDEFLKTSGDQKDESEDANSDASDYSGTDDQDENSGGDDDASAKDDEGSNDSDDQSSDSDGDGNDSDSDEAKDSENQDEDDDNDTDDSKGSEDDDSADSDDKSADSDDQ